MPFPCEKCRGEGVIIIGEWNDQYDRTHYPYDVCPDCGGSGEIEEEPLEVKRRAHGARRSVGGCDAQASQTLAEDCGDPNPTGQEG